MIRRRVSVSQLNSLLQFALTIASYSVTTTLIAGKVDDSTTVKRRLQESAEARADANLGLAYELLHDVIRIDPENQQARWQLGQVKVKDVWLSIEESQRRAASNPQQAKYETQKEAVAGAADSAALARWCRKND